MQGSILIRNGLLVTMDQNRRIFKGNLYIENGIIQEVGSLRTEADQIIDADERIVMPGFIQTHIHLCQVLFRGLADDVDVVDWLKHRIWPFESAHDEDSIHASANLGIAELIAGGTTTALSMETTRYTDGVFAAALENGFRLIAGNAMMDIVEPGTEMRGLSTKESIAESKRLHREWDGKGEGKIQYAIMPRGARNCSPELVELSRQFSREEGLLFHTHVSENGPLSARLIRETGLSDLELLASGANLTSRSRSLSARKSSRSADPNTRSSAIFHRRQNSVSCSLGMGISVRIAAFSLQFATTVPQPRVGNVLWFSLKY